MCRWDHPTPGILTVAVNGTNYRLLEDYGKITDLQVKAAWMACNATDASPRAKQNSQMMYNILNIIDSQGNTRSFLYNYGQLSTEEVRTQSRNQWTNQHTRDAQNTEMLYHFLFESLDENFKATVLLKNYNYQVTMGTYTTEDGPCLLKQIIVSTFVDTRATASQIR